MAESIEDPYWRDYALRWVAEAYAPKNPERAVEIAGMISTDSLRDETLGNLSYIFSREGSFKPAIETAKRIKDRFARKKALRAISTVLAEAIVERGVSGISLSELGLDERDLEALKPLPPGISFKDGKLMPGGKILRMKGEFGNKVVPVNEAPRRTPQKPVFDIPGREEVYLIEYFNLMSETANVEELEYWAGLVDEPLRSTILEDAGLIHLRIGNVEKALELARRSSRTEGLGFLLAVHFIELGKPEKIPKFAERIQDPVKRLLLLEKAVKMGLLEDHLVGGILKPKSDYVFARLLKFLAFEMLEEAKLRKDDSLLETSRKIFEKGIKIQREFEARLLGP